MLRRTLQHILVVALLTLLWVPQGVAQDDIEAGIEAGIEAIEDLRENHAAQLQSFEASWTSFEALLGRIDELKDERERSSTLASDEALQGTLAIARDAALELEALSLQLQALVEEITALERNVVDLIDDEITAREDALASAERGSRAQLLEELTQYSVLRDDYLQPLPSAPLIDLDVLVVGYDDLWTPEELLATADELDYNESQLIEYLSEVEDRISDLERQLELAERSREFYAEASLFEEGVSTGRAPDRDRAPANPVTSSAETGGSRATAGDNATAGAQDSTDSRSDESPGDVAVGATNGAESPTSDPAPSGGMEGLSNDTDADEAFAGVTDGDGLTADAQETSDDSEPVPDAPVVGSGPDPVGLSSALTPVGRADGDDVLLWLGTTDLDTSAGRGVAGRIEQLEEERERTRQAIEVLRQRRETIIERAQELEEIDF